MDVGGVKRAFYLGRYNCIERLGTGPLGETFRAKIYGVAGFEKQFAVKKLHAMLCQDEEFVARFVNAATAYAGLDHERIARVHEVNVQGSQYYLAIDLIRGVDLERLLSILAQRGEALPTDDALLIGCDLADALASSHARSDLLPGGVLHLGLSPQSVMVNYDGEVRLLDIGLVGALVQPGWSDDDELLPSLAYLAPEVLAAQPADARADVFSLAAVLYQMVAGRRPYPGIHARDVRLQIDQGPPGAPPTDGRLQSILTQALHPDPARRPAAMAHMREGLGAILGNRTTRARSDLSALVKRLVRPERKTGSFAVVAAPLLPPPLPARPATSASERPWAPPPKQALVLPSAPAAVPMGPQLSTIPPRNTFAGLGADDQVLVPIELLELPGSPTAREMPVFRDPNALGDDEPTRPIEKLDREAETDTAPHERAAPDEGRNGSGLYSTGESTRDTTPGLPAPPPPSAQIFSLPPESERANTVPELSPVTATEAQAPAPLKPLVPEQRSIVPPRARGGSPGPYVPPPLELPPLPTDGPSLRLVGLIVLIVTLGVSAAIYFGFLHGRDDAPAPIVKSQDPAPAEVAPSAPVPPPVAAPAAPARPAPVPTPIVAAPAAPVAAPAPVAVTPKPAVEGPPVAGAGTLDLTTTPSGAAVFVDGEPRGPSPLHLSLTVGSHQVVVLAEGQKLRREPVRVAAGVTQLNLTLEAAALPAELLGGAGLKVRCKTQQELRILVDGADTGRQCPNEVRISVASGPHKIGLYSPRTDRTYETEKDLRESGDHSTRVYVKY